MYGDCYEDGYDRPSPDIFRRDVESGGLDDDNAGTTNETLNEFDYLDDLDEFDDLDDSSLLLGERSEEDVESLSSFLGSPRAYRVGTFLRDCDFTVNSRGYPSSSVLHDRPGRTGLDKVIRCVSMYMEFSIIIPLN
jgi:hypothetical protein